MNMRNSKVNPEHVLKLNTTFHTPATVVQKKQRIVPPEREAE